MNLTDLPLSAPSPAAPRFERGQLIHEAGAAGSAWRVTSGVVRYDMPGARGGEHAFAGLALAGDIVGAEALLFGQFAYRATALTSCELAPWPGRAAADSGSLLRALATAEGRAAKVVALRSGQAVQRVARLIGLLLPVPAGTTVTAELPSLRDMAEITALTIETVSRAVSGLRRRGALEPEAERRGGGRKPCRVDTALLPAS